MKKSDSSSAVVTGSGHLPAHLINPNSQFTIPRPSDPLGGLIVDLLNLNPSLKLQFRELKLEQLDDDTKKQLLSDLHEVLGVKTTGV